MCVRCFVTTGVIRTRVSKPNRPDSVFPVYYPSCPPVAKTRRRAVRRTLTKFSTKTLLAVTLYIYVCHVMREGDRWRNNAWRTESELYTRNVFKRNFPEWFEPTCTVLPVYTCAHSPSATPGEGGEVGLLEFKQYLLSYVRATTVVPSVNRPSAVCTLHASNRRRRLKGTGICSGLYLD